MHSVINLNTLKNTISAHNQRLSPITEKTEVTIQFKFTTWKSHLAKKKKKRMHQNIIEQIKP